MRKVNVNTETRQALFGALQDTLAAGVPGFDVTRLFAPALAAMQQTVEAKLRLFATPG